VTNLYTVLNLTDQATQLEIKKAYRELVKQFHPDSLSSVANHEKIVELNSAYEILGDPERRLKYDQRQSAQRKKRQESSYSQYNNSAQQTRYEQIDITQWQKTVYGPIEKIIKQILSSRSRQIDDLAGDPFDDLLMQEFQIYLENCQIALEKAMLIFRSRPNPPKVAKAAASIYYCLNQIFDGLEEFQRFTYSYDDSALHQGQEFFYLAQQFLKETQRHLQSSKN